MKAIIILLTTAISVALGLPISFPDFRQIKRVDDQDFYGEAQQGNPMSDSESNRGTDVDRKRPSLACQKLMLQTMPEEVNSSMDCYKKTTNSSTKLEKLALTAVPARPPSTNP